MAPNDKMNYGITFALTSCNRVDLLEKTIDSFLEFNTAIIEQYIISEDDKDCDLSRLIEKYKDLPFLWYKNKKEKRGMLGNIDFLYSKISTHWVFHCEDDWQFYRSGFIEESMCILAKNKNILQVWLREQNDTNGHPIEEKVYTEDYIKETQYKLVGLDYMEQFSGYSTNPGLRRLKDKVSFEALNKLGPANFGPEGKVAFYYRHAGFRTAITMKGFVKHIGEGRTTL